MKNNPPVAPGIFKHRSVAFRPPFLRILLRPHNGIVRRILPWPKRRLRSGRDNHVAGCRAGSSSFSYREVIIIAMFGNLWAFHAETLDRPSPWNWPTSVNPLKFARNRQTVFRKRNITSAAEIQIAFSAGIYGMSRIDKPDFQFNGVAPRAGNSGLATAWRAPPGMPIRHRRHSAPG